jgi:tetratricopeptide (TPR) repeat protein
MQAYSQPLVKLHMEASRFIRERSLRLLHVVADAVLHEAAVEILAALEYRGDNRSPFVILQEPHKRSDPGWERRALTARRQHERRGMQMAEHGEVLGELPEPPASKGLVGLAEQLGQLLLVRPIDTEGLVVLLSPSYVEAPETWQQAIGVLLSIQGLAAARLVILDRDRSSLGGLVARHEGRALFVACRVEGESPKAVLADTLDEEILSFEGPVGARPKGVIPPRRRNDPPARAPTPEAVRQLAVSRSVLLASVAVEEGRMPDAIAHQRRARDASMDAGRVEQGVMMELVLGGYLLTAGAVAQAEQSYARAAAVAEAAELPDKAAMARLALGSSRLVRNDRTGALVEYAQASTLAERGGHDALALHACRLTGDVARELRMDAQAIAFWAKALEIAERDPPTAPLTSAGLVALQLAVLCRERGQYDEADVFLNKADALVRIEPERLARAKAEDVQQEALRTHVAPGELLPAHEAPARPLPTEGADPRPSAAESSDVAPTELGREESLPRERPSSIEGTALLTWADIAAFHREPPAPTNDQQTSIERIHHWSSVEQDTLRHTTTEIIGRETTALLSQEELAALRGEIALRPAQVAPTVERTVRLDPAELRRLRGETDAPAVPSSYDAPAVPSSSAPALPIASTAPAAVLPMITGEGTELYTHEMIRALRAAWTKRSADEGSEPGGEER